MGFSATPIHMFYSLVEMIFKYFIVQKSTSTTEMTKCLIQGPLKYTGVRNEIVSGDLDTHLEIKLP